MLPPLALRAQRAFHSPRLLATPASRTAQLLARRHLTTTTDAPTAQAVAAEEVEKSIAQGPSAEVAAQTSTAKRSRIDAVAKRRLHFLKDPYTIGKAVEELLAKDSDDALYEALQITRLASKDHKVTVSWNHLINYLMGKEKLMAAVKMFNEMKKRAQLPNAQTYTIIFRGCAQSPHATLAVYHATRLYYAMLDSDRIKPNTMHMNAVLQVCARAQDMESLFSVAKTASQPLRAPDSMTYTTLLNGLRFSTAQPHHRKVKEGDDEIQLDRENVAVSINRARALWEEVVTSWRMGRIVIDEELVCSMGRLLLMGSYHDNDDVLSLVEQAMGIARLDRVPLARAADKAEVDVADSAKTEAAEAEAGVVEPEPTEAAAAGAEAEATVTPEPTETAAVETVEAEAAEPTESAVAEAEPESTETTATEATEATTETSANTQEKTPPPPPRKNQFVPLPADVFSTGSPGGNKILYAHPGRNTLSLILTSLGATRKTSLAGRYWEMLLDEPYNVVPDSENWFRMLKALRRGHNSGRTVQLMATMPKEMMNERTFQLAMATCAADNLNDNVFASAGKILDLMNHTLRVPDCYVLRLYLQTALSSNRRFRDQADEPMQREAAKAAYGQQIVRALARLWDPLRLAANATAYPMPAPDTATEAERASYKIRRAQSYNARREVIALARQMVGAADMVVTEGMADEETLRNVRTSRNLLNRQITRFYADRETAEPNLKKEKAGRHKSGRAPARDWEEMGRQRFEE